MTAKKSVKQVRRGNKRWLNGVILIVAVGWLVISLQTKPSIRNTPTQKEETKQTTVFVAKVDPKAWPDVPVHGAPPPLGVMPKLPTLQVVPHLKTVEDWQRMQANFLALVEAHPDRDLAKNLGEQLRTHHVAVEIDESAGIARFAMVKMSTLRSQPDPWLSTDALQTFDLGDGELAAEMYIVGPSFIGRPKSDPEVLLSLVILRHEYEHQLQFEHAVPGSLDRRSFEINFDIRKESERVCTLHWQHERDAYRANTLAAWAYGHPEILHFRMGDTVQDTAAFDQAVFNLITQKPDTNKVHPCFYRFAILAGHPHPEAFLP